MRKLQISLPDFRRLCIFKGIYPREPRSRKKVNRSATPLTTFYYTKDIQYLLHEPLLARFREQKAVSKKIARSLGRGEVGDAARHEKSTSTGLSLDHIIKERYPTFVDALRDLDDALSLLFLFANLPSTSNAPPKTIALCQRLCLEFEHYLITAHSLRKSFLSIKGIYYQATIQGQDILWLVPYKFVQRVTGDVDFRIMATFVEFYTTLLSFVNYRLYTYIGLVYPPKFNAKSDEQGAELTAFMLEGRDIEGQKRLEDTPDGEADLEANGKHELPEEVRKQIEQIQEIETGEMDEDLTDVDQQESREPLPTDVDTFKPISNDADTLLQPAPSFEAYSTLFSKCTFYLSREVPKSSLEFLLRAFGCKRIAWPVIHGGGAFTNDEFDPSITHQVIDRPPISQLSTPPNTKVEYTETDRSALQKQENLRMLNRTYIQPQWVWDSINALKLLRPDLYAPGATLPPHLSPWVKPTKGSYDPTVPLVEQEKEGEAEADALENAITQDEIAQAKDDDASTASTSSSPALQAPTAESDSDAPSFAGFASEEDDSSTRLHQRELEAEALGLTPSHPAAKRKGILKPPSSQTAEAEDFERRKMMLSRKKRKLVERMEYGNAVREKEAEKLRGKKRRVEREKRGAGA